MKLIFSGFFVLVAPAFAMLQCWDGLHPNLDLTLIDPITRNVRKLGIAGGAYVYKNIDFANGRLLDPKKCGARPTIKGHEGKTSFVYDATASLKALGPADTYRERANGSGDVQRAIQNYLKTKDFNDGTLDIFIQVRPGDWLPNPDLSRVYEIAAFFGVERGVAHHADPNNRGMARDPEKRRQLRIFVLSSPPTAETGEVPVEFLYEASSIANELKIQVALTVRYVSIAQNGEVVIPGPNTWALFYPEKP